MSRRAGVIAGILLTLVSASTVAQSGNDPSTPFERGQAALAAHDPTSAIAQFEQVDTQKGREWLAVALMMESRSPSDRYVERAFEAAQLARLDRPEQARPRAETASRLAQGDLVIAYLISKTHGYAWAFDREAFVGFPLPPPGELATAVAAARGYIDRNDREGVQRIAETVLPALLGPAAERLSGLRRLIVVTDGPLRELSISDFGRSAFPRGLEVVTADYGSLAETLSRARTTPPVTTDASALSTWLLGSLVAAVLVCAGVIMLKRRRSSVA